MDSDTPIRMLIAECEEPQTVLAAALYFARLFGIADKVDVSPLFETESAMEHGARFPMRSSVNLPIATMRAYGGGFQCRPAFRMPGVLSASYRPHL